MSAWPAAESENAFTIAPPNTAVSKAAKGRTTAKGSPMRLKVAIMESTPVWGVAIRKDATAPFDAPSLRSDIAVGMTPQEHSGRGMPKRAAFTTDVKLGAARCRV